MKSLLLTITVFPVLCFAQFNQAWVKTYNGIGDYSDHFTCLTSDENGTVYAGGYTQITDENADFLICAFNTSGNLLWKKSWRGNGQGPDIAYGIAYHNGTLYATGEVSNAGVGFDFFTIAVTTGGDSIWGAHYNDATYNQYDQANAIAIDDSGNVLVTGESDRDPSSVTNDDFLTIKYNPSGVQQWVARYNGSGNETDRAVAVDTDASGNVFVAGRSFNGGDDDYATIKYDASGSVVWTRIFDNGGIDRAADMGVDAQGNCYVTGRSDNGNDDDFRTLKYSPTGVELFNVAFDFVEDDRADYIAVNPDGTFAVAGRSDGTPSAILNYNYRVVKYGADGAQLWSATYDGSAGNDDIVQDVTLSPAGEVLVTGYSDVAAGANIQNDIVSILYNASGSVSWTKVYAGPAGNDDEAAACIFDSQGKCWIAGHSENNQSRRDASLIQYDSQGTMVSSSLWNGSGDNSDNVRETIMDNTGNIYLCGYSVGKDTDRDMFVCKLTANGDTLWTRRLTGTLFGSDEEANAIALDNNNNVIISGYTKNSGTGSDITLLKFTSGGNLLWTTQFNGTANESDRSYDLATDAQGNIYITGKTDINPSPIIINDEIFTAKYSSNGNLLWSSIHNGGGGIDRGRNIHLSANGSVYVCGQSDNGTNEDAIVIKYNSNGAEQWTYAFNSNHDNFKQSILGADESVTLLVNVSDQLDSLPSHIALARVSASGQAVWEQLYDHPSGLALFGEHLAVSASGDFVIVGSIANAPAPAYNYDCLTLQYNASGVYQWAVPYNSPAGLDDIGDAVTIDNSGHIIIACHSNASSAEDINYQLVLLAYDSNGGTFLNSGVFALSDTLNICNTLTLAGNQLVVGGSIWQAESQRDIVVVKYDLALGLHEVDAPSISLFPNPTFGALQLTIPGEFLGQTAQVVNLIGRKVKEISLNSTQQIIDLSDLPAGYYFIQYGSSQAHKTTFIKH
jgi:uncharacterized delta-60 repeat protein